MDKIYFLRFNSLLKKLKLKISLGFKINVVKKAKKVDKNCGHSGCFYISGYKIEKRILTDYILFNIRSV